MTTRNRSSVAVWLIVLALLISAAPSASATTAANAPRPAEEPAGPPVQAPTGSATTTAPACSASGKAAYVCVEVSSGADAVSQEAAAQDVSFPEWCADGTGLLGYREQACRVSQVTLTTYRIAGGVTTVTGQVQFNAFDYTFTAVDTPGLIHQFGLASYAGWGDALGASVSGTASAAGACTLDRSTFSLQPVTPFLTMRSGDAAFSSTATAIGAVGDCTTTWDLLFTTPGYPPASGSSTLDTIRCDNAVGASGTRARRAGCVVPWYASEVLYSQSRYPSLANHVAQAQSSGLPGAGFNDPLYRTTDAIRIARNRRLACGDAPRIPGRSCDEYPLATTLQGLAAGGTLRTFDGCDINAPRETGPTGVSACMISDADNNAQGGLMQNFYYDWRVLDGDPYRVGISP